MPDESLDSTDYNDDYYDYFIITVGLGLTAPAGKGKQYTSLFKLSACLCVSNGSLAKKWNVKYA